MADQTEAEIVEGLTLAGMKPHIVGSEDAYVMVPAGHSMYPLEQFKEAPERIRATPAFESLESFIAYVKKFKEENGTTIFLGVDGSAVAVLDYHGRQDPRWGSHCASYTPRKSERWEMWTAACKRPFTQRDFAEFIEDNIADFLAPPGGDMLTTAKTLQIKKDVRFKSDVRLDNGDTKLEYEEVTKTGRGDIDIPTEFVIAIPVLEDEEDRHITLRLRSRLDNGVVTFTMAIKQQQALLDEVKRYIFATIKNDTTIAPLFGRP